MTEPDELDPVDVANCMRAILLTTGPLPADELFNLLADEGIDATLDDLDDAVDATDPLFTVIDLEEPPVYTVTEELLRGRAFTHVLTAEEIAGSYLGPPEVDFVAQRQPIGLPPFTELNGQPVSVLYDPEWRFVVPDGTLSNFAAGDRIALELGADGISLTRSGAVEWPAPAVIDDVELIFPRSDDFFNSHDLSDFVNWLLIRHPELFTRAMPSVSELLAAWGLETDGEGVARSGEALEARDGGPKLLAEVADELGLTDAEVDAVARVMVRTIVFHELSHRDEPPNEDELRIDDLLPALTHLASPQAAEALRIVAVGGSAHQANFLRSILEPLVELAPRRAQASVHWLIGHTADLHQEVAAAEKEFERALALDPDHPLALNDLAAIRSERGDAAGSLSLLTRAGDAAELNLLDKVSRFVPADHPEIGRNDPCFCGSGQKYKKCHLGKSDFSLEDRIPWLYWKLAHRARRGEGGRLLSELAAVRAQYWTDKDALERALDDPMVLDATLFDGGGIEDFLNDRGAVLPDDERLLATAWSTVERSVYEVERNDPGVGFLLRDLRTGEKYEVAEKAGSKHLRRGDLISVRLLDAGGPSQIHSGIEPVPDQLRDATLAVLDRQGTDEADPYETVQILTARFAPPTLTSGEGDPLVFCTGEYAVTKAAVQKLIKWCDKEFEASGPGQWEWTTEGSRILASLVLADTTLTVTSPTERRFEEILTRLRAVVNLKERSVERLSGADMLAQAQTQAQDKQGPPRQPRPEEAAILQEQVLKYERKWLDESIPALGGATPREAADDPTRRDDLVRLLESFDGYPSGPGAMSPDRLRAALGLSRR